MFPWSMYVLPSGGGLAEPYDGKSNLFDLQPGDKFRIYEAPDGTIAYCEIKGCTTPAEATVIKAHPSMIFGWSSEHPNPYRPWADNGCNRMYTPTVDWRVEKLNEAK